jgi:hypothetical protein
MRGQLYSHSNIVFINPIELYWIATIKKYFNMGCVTLWSLCIMSSEKAANFSAFGQTFWYRISSNTNVMVISLYLSYQSLIIYKMHTKILQETLNICLPFLTINKATRNWHRYSCFDNISWMFSLPSTEKPCEATYVICLEKIITNLCFTNPVL